jgi:hypothetical protein
MMLKSLADYSNIAYLFETTLILLGFYEIFLKKRFKIHPLILLFMILILIEI